MGQQEVDNALTSEQAEAIIKANNPFSPDNRKVAEACRLLFAANWQADLSKDQFWAAFVCLRAAELEVGDACSILSQGWTSANTLAKYSDLPQDQRDGLHGLVFLPRVDAAGDDVALNHQLPARIARLRAASKFACDMGEKVKAQQERRDVASALDPIEDEVPFDQYSKLLAKWKDEHGKIDLPPNKVPTRTLLALLTKMKRKGSWEAVSLDLCHPRHKYKVGKGTILDDQLGIAVKDGVLQTIKTGAKDSKYVTEDDIWTNLEVLKVAYHLTDIVSEHVFQMHIEDLRAKQSMHAKLKVVACDKKIRAHWIDLMLSEGTGFETTVKEFSKPTSTQGAAYWANLLWVEPGTALLSANQYQNSAPPFQKVKPQPEEKIKKKQQRPGAGGGEPFVPRARVTEPFNFMKGGIRVCHFHAWRGDCRNGDHCVMSHSCPHKDCPLTEKHRASEAHAADWQRVFPGDVNPFPNPGKGGKGGKGKGKGKGRR